MSKKDVFGDEVAAVDTRASFEDLFGPNQSMKKLKIGDSFQAEILSISKELTYVSTPTNLDGVLPTSELLDAQKQLTLKKGDRIEVVVLKIGENELRLRKKSSTASGEVENLEDAFDMELPVEGKVKEVVNGGFRVQVQGATAFCPISQMDRTQIKDPQTYLHKKFDFVITQYDPKGRNIVVSRRKLLDLQRAEHEGAFLQSTQVNSIMMGQVTRLEAYGAFVDLGHGVEGLVHISEISWARLKHPSEALTVGQSVSVKVLSMEDQGERIKISLSIKQGGGETDPWLMVEQNFPVGSRHMGTVEKKEAFGLFIQIAPGITALLPRSAWRDSADAAGFEAKKRGDAFQVQVANVQPTERRISLALPGELNDESWRGVQQKAEGFGTLAAAFAKLKK